MTVQDHTEQNNIKSDKKKKRKNEKSNVKENDEVILTNKKSNAYVVFHLLYFSAITNLFCTHINLYFRLNVEKSKMRI